MKINKPKFWDQKKGFLSTLLIPLSLIVCLVLYLKTKFVRSKSFNIPIICVGNIYIGGTGKTPTAIFLAKELSKLSKTSVIVRKFYRNHYDEHAFIEKYYDYLILNKNRIEAINEAISKGFEFAILDDGFQDLQIKKKINIICFNENQLIGNGLIYPSGPLRDRLKSLVNAQVILINGQKNFNFEKKLLKINKNLQFFYSEYLPQNLEEFKNKNLLALAGIGNPSNFFELLEKNNLKVKRKLNFPDHYQFKKKEMLDIIDEAKKENLQIIMTEKDYLRIKQFNLKGIGYLKIDLNIHNSSNLIEKILKTYDKNF